MSRSRQILALVASFTLSVATVASAKDLPQTSHDGLELVPNTRAALVYLKPGTDFSGYKRVALLDCEIAFKRNWQRQQNSVNPFAVTKRDMDEIRTKLAELFADVFRDELTKGGYELTDTAASDVLVVLPSIIDLDIAAPGAVEKASRSRTFATSPGEMTLVIEMFDSTTREILGRAADRKTGRNSGAMTWHNAATNKRDAERVLRVWARALRDGLDALRGA